MRQLLKMTFQVSNQLLLQYPKIAEIKKVWMESFSSLHKNITVSPVYSSISVKNCASESRFIIRLVIMTSFFNMLVSWYCPYWTESNRVTKVYVNHCNYMKHVCNNTTHSKCHIRAGTRNCCNWNVLWLT